MDDLPIRYPQWKYGMEYEVLRTPFYIRWWRAIKYWWRPPYEMKVNNNPIIIYCLDESDQDTPT